MNKRVKISRKSGSTGAFTLVELLVVIAIMGIVAAMVIGLAAAANAGERRKKATAQLFQIITAIEAYKKEHGFYPPDNPNDCTQPPLFYELKGATVEVPPSPTPATTKLLGSFPTITAQDYATAFNRSGVINSKPKNADVDDDAKVVDHFAGLKSQQSTNFTIGGAEIMLLTVGIEARPAGNPRVNTWRYVSTNPTNNGAGSFDLWAEVAIKGKTEIIGNWSN